MNKRIIFLFIVGTLLFGMPSAVSAQKVIGWEALEGLDYVEQDDGWGVDFGEKVEQLAGETIQIYGFMMPLETTMKQSHFILSMLPLDGCQFCAPGTQAQFIEVKVKDGEGIEYTLEPIDIAGTFELQPDAPMGVYFLISDARKVD